MTLTPDYSTFAQAYEAGEAGVLRGASELADDVVLNSDLHGHEASRARARETL